MTVPVTGGSLTLIGNLTWGRPTGPGDLRDFSLDLQSVISFFWLLLIPLLIRSVRKFPPSIHRLGCRGVEQDHVELLKDWEEPWR